MGAYAAPSPHNPGTFSASGGALLFQLLSTLHERTSIITTNLSFGEWATVLRDSMMTTAMLDRLTHRCHILETGNDSLRFKNSSAKATKPNKKKSRPPPTDLIGFVRRTMLCQRYWSASPFVLPVNAVAQKDANGASHRL